MKQSKKLYTQLFIFKEQNFDYNENYIKLSWVNLGMIISVVNTIVAAGGFVHEWHFTKEPNRFGFTIDFYCDDIDKFNSNILLLKANDIIKFAELNIDYTDPNNLIKYKGKK